MTYDAITVGDFAFFEKTISETDVYQFAGVTGDFNQMHVNEVYASKTRFGKRIAHGMLAGSLFSTIFGTQLPGLGAVYISQSLEFKAPVFFGDTIRAVVTVTEKMPKGRVRFACTATNQQGEIVISGEAILLPPREAV